VRVGVNKWGWIDGSLPIMPSINAMTVAIDSSSPDDKRSSSDRERSPGLEGLTYLNPEVRLS